MTTLMDDHPEATTNNYKTVLEKLILFLKREQTSEGSYIITPSDVLNKIIGIASDAGLEDVKERALNE